MALQMRLQRTSEVLDLTQEIAQNVESARRVLSVGPDHVDLEVYNFARYDVLDPRLYAETKRIVYVYQADPSAIVREVYVSTDAAQPEEVKPFLSAADLTPPDEAAPYFDASYLVAESTVGVRIALAIRPPGSKERWVPVKREAYVRAN